MKTPTKPEPTKPEPNEMATHLQVLIKSKHTVLAIRSKEERRIEAMIRGVADSLLDKETAAPYQVRYWSCTKGITEFDENGEERVVDNEAAADPDGALIYIAENEQRMIYVLRDFHPYLKDGADGGDKIRRRLRELGRRLKTRPPSVARTVILLSPVLEIPPELEGEIHVVEWPLPKQSELKAVVEASIKSIQDPEIKAAAEKEDIDRIVKAAVGLTMEQAHGAISRSLVEKRTLDARLIAEEKKNAIGDDGVLEWLEPLPGGLSGVGGFDLLKAFALQRKLAFSPAARAYNLDAQKGLFLAGVPGCGKTLFARALAGEYGFFAVRLVVANLFGSLLGESEQKFQKAHKRLRILAPILVLIDEIDKATGSGGERDGGTTGRVKGEFLTFLQEETDPECPIYKIATANNVEDLSEHSPELIRDGRWDERFFIDLPTLVERADIVDIHVKRRFREAPARNFDTIDAKRVAIATHQFSGAELEAVVSSAMFRGFSESRPTTTDDLLAAAKGKIPLAETAKGRVQALRAWANGKAKRASSRDQETSPDDGTTFVAVV